MKKLIIIIGLSTIALTAFSQSVRRIRDPHIVAQEKRQAFQQWGDWQPKAKYFLGVQTNLNYALVWGWLAPSRNQQYRNGADIRPLGPAGLQNQRFASLLVQENKAKEIKEDVDEVYNEALSEFQHSTSATAPADPLYLLYYKRMLNNLQNMDAYSTNPYDWGITNWQAWQRINNYGLLNESREKILILQDRYKFGLNSNMPRGKRILLYHDLLKEWRRLEKYFAYINLQGKNAIKAQEQVAKYEQMKRDGKVTKERRDAEIFMDVLMRSKYNN